MQITELKQNATGEDNIDFVGAKRNRVKAIALSLVGSMTK
jgi:hypothetical protein